MQASPTVTPIQERIFISLDLEMTGLDPERDAIIEIGAVKFSQGRVLETLQTFVNPNREIPEFIQRLTNISPDQVKNAPQFSSVSDQLANFVGNHPIIGHNIQFDLRFLDNHGLSLLNSKYDTWDLASIFLPDIPEYSLAYLTRYLEVGHISPHRALDDADATREVFLSLIKKASNVDQGLLAYIISIANKSQWQLSTLLSSLPNAETQDQSVSTFGLNGLDMDYLSTRLGRPERRKVDNQLTHFDTNKLATLLDKGGPLQDSFSDFEYRPEQVQMLEAVTSAIFEGSNLVVEGGTGVGKSMAYLLPAAIYAASKGQRVVISTNTINLQEQLVRKDIPAICKSLEEANIINEGVITSAVLKGRSNYLCLKRWSYLSNGETISLDEARLIGKTAVWLQQTTSGDRGEINISGRDTNTWSKVSAADKGWCAGLKENGICFLKSSREKAEQAHIIVVNHALLLSDLMHGGSLIPDYQHLIIDEAHNLEDEATSQFGFHVTPEKLNEIVDQQGRLITNISARLGSPSISPAIKQNGESVISSITNLTPHLRDLWAQMWVQAERFLDTQQKHNNNDQSSLLIEPKLRASQSWLELRLLWENLDVGLSQQITALSKLQGFLEGITLGDSGDSESLAMESLVTQDEINKLKYQLESVISQEDASQIIWMNRDQFSSQVGLHVAPLQVGKTLETELFERKESVVLTSATLSTQGTFNYIKSRLGLPDDIEELLVGSPFDYRKAASLMIPEDMPQPNADGYVGALSRVFKDLGTYMEGHTMGLFTSYSALRSVAQRVRSDLSAEGIQVFAQGVDGSPQQLTRRFIENPKAVLLGTSSFWEGVDFPDGVLKSLVLTRLPFQVPNDPIVKARSEQYSDPFNEYSVPQAVLRFRQGIGRLIRRKGDKGSIVLLDRRVTGRTYGKAFLDSIPPCTLTPCSLNTIGRLSAEWIQD
jgi:DNA polymerase-3 subunit epsilon/ATP-dependent DNA helicase DinG